MSKKKKPQPTGIDPKNILRAFKEQDKPLSTGALAQTLGVTKRDRKPLKKVLGDLTAQGKLVRIKGAWGLPEKMRLITGRIEVVRSGAGFVVPDDQRRKDVFVPPGQLGDAMHRDRVVCALTGRMRRNQHEGRVVRVLERRKSTLTARVLRRLGGASLLCTPSDPRLDFNIMVNMPKDAAMPKPDDILVVAPGEKLEQRLWAGEFKRALGREDDLKVQEEVVKTEHAIPREFPASALAEAGEFPESPGEEDFAGREDLRGLNLVTIDGAAAKDFDDAVHVERKGKGWRLTVAIADVSHYVRPGTALDREAVARGNSYYFPKSVEPMLPERLSNGLCSLNPGVPRLAVAAVMDFNAGGERTSSRIFPAVIASAARLTYAQVNRAVLLGDADEKLKLGPLMGMLERAEALARVLNTRRSSRGSIDFDLPEPEIFFNIFGETVDIRPKARHFGHQIIEEFMIAANEAVAEFLTEKGVGCMYRVHPAPDKDKLAALFKLIRTTDLASAVPAEPTPTGLNKLIHASEGTKQEFLVSRLVLRSMKRAAYSPQNDGHFGLASDCYCHFTSPIRRYADLAVHRLLKAAMGLPGYKTQPFKRLKDLGADLSARERVAMEAERDILKRLTILFLRDRVGEAFTGVVSSMSDYGFWVELSEVMAEGMVRLSAMADDYYAYLQDRQIILGQGTGRVLRLGEPVSVRLEDADLSRLEVNLSLLEGGRSAKASRTRKPKPRKR